MITRRSLLLVPAVVLIGSLMPRPSCYMRLLREGVEVDRVEANAVVDEKYNLIHFHGRTVSRPILVDSVQVMYNGRELIRWKISQRLVRGQLLGCVIGGEI
jgi:hypothetical protein